MLERWLSALAGLVTTRRSLVLVTTALLTVASIAALPLLEADPSPRALLASADADQEDVAGAFREHFGSTDNVVAVLVEDAHDVLQPAPLGYLYRLGEHFAKAPRVERVESLARTPFRQPDAEADDEALSLDDLDDLDDLDAEGEGGDPLASDPEITDALSDVVAAAPEIFPMGLASLAEKTGGAAKFGPLITSAQPSAAQVAALREAVAAAPLLRRRLISDDGRIALLAIVFSDELASHRELHEVVSRVRGWIADNPPPEGVTVHLGGLPVVRTTMVELMRKDQAVLIPGTLLVCLLVLVVAFRWWAGVALPLAKVTVAALWVMGGMALFGVKLNVVNNVLPALLIIIGLSDSIHLVNRYRQECARTGDLGQSLRTTVFAIGGACLGTSATTAAGLFSLQVSRTAMLGEFGLVAGIGVVLSYFVTVLFLPAALRNLRPPHAAEMDEGDRRATALDRLVVNLTAWVLRRPRAVLLGALLVTAGAAYVAADVRVDSALLDQFSEDDPNYRITRLLEEQFDGIRALEVSLWSETPERFWQPESLKALARVADWAAAQPGVLSTAAPTDYFTATWQTLTGAPAKAEDALRSAAQLKGIGVLFEKRARNPLASFLTRDGKRARLRIKLADVGSRATLAFARGLDEQLRAQFRSLPDVRYAFTGDAYVSARGLGAIVADLTGSLATAVVVILLLITFIFRSLRLGLLSVPPNLIPLVLVMAWMVVRDIPLNAATAIIFSISIGLAVDGSIHVLSRFREEAARQPLLTLALLRSARGTGRALVIACTSLILGFGVLLLSRFVPIQRFAELIAISIAGCLVSTLVVQPALLRLAGRAERAVWSR